MSHRIQRTWWILNSGSWLSSEDWLGFSLWFVFGLRKHANLSNLWPIWSYCIQILQTIWSFLSTWRHSSRMTIKRLFDSQDILSNEWYLDTGKIHYLKTFKPLSLMMVQTLLWCYHPAIGRVYINRHVLFDEDQFSFSDCCIDLVSTWGTPLSQACHLSYKKFKKYVLMSHTLTRNQCIKYFHLVQCSQYHLLLMRQLILLLNSNINQWNLCNITLKFFFFLEF